MAKHPWKKIRADYLSGKYLNMRELAEAYGIRPSNLRTHAALKRWGQFRAQIMQRTEEIVIEKIAQTEAQILAEKRLAMKERHLGYAHMLQAKAFERLKNKIKKDDGSDAYQAFSSDALAVRALEAAVRMEKAALGEPDEENVQFHNTTQINQLNVLVNELPAGQRRAVTDALEQALGTGKAPVDSDRKVS